MQKNRLWTLWPLLNLLFPLACACASNLKLYWKHSQSIVTNLCLFMALLWDVYSWDQAGKWNFMGLVTHKAHQQFTVRCSLQKLSKNTVFFFFQLSSLALSHSLLPPSLWPLSLLFWTTSSRSVLTQKNLLLSWGGQTQWEQKI